MNTPFEDDIIDNKRVIDFHTHPYGCRDEFMGMYDEDFYLEPEEMPGDLGNAAVPVRSFGIRCQKSGRGADSLWHGLSDLQSEDVRAGRFRRTHYSKREGDDSL